MEASAEVESQTLPFLLQWAPVLSVRLTSSHQRLQSNSASVENENENTMGQSLSDGPVSNHFLEF